MSLGLAILLADSTLTLSSSGIAVTANTFLPASTAVTTTAPVAGGGNLSTGLTLSIPKASSTANGYLSSTDWAVFNSGGGGSGIPGTTQLSTAAPITGGGVISTGLTIAITQASSTTNGYLGSTDWTTFNNKGSGGGVSTSISTTSPLAGGGATSTNLTLSIPPATSTANGYLTSTDWITFNNKGTSSTSGTVTSVGLSLPSIFTVTASPVTSSGTLTATLTNQVQATVFAGPTSGVSTTPTFRLLVSTDIPALPYIPATSSTGFVSTSRLISTTAPLAGGGDLSANRTLSLPQASSTANGYLSSTDWTTFNNKASSTGSTSTPSYGWKNRIINGNMDFWQRGSTFTINSSTNLYTADRWLGSIQGSSTGTMIVSQATTSLSQIVGNVTAKYTLSAHVSVATNNGPTVEQRIEGVRTLAGQTVTLSFQAECANADTYSLSAYAIQYFGTGGSPSATTSTLISSTFTMVFGYQKFSASFTVPSVTSSTIGTDGNDYLAIQFVMPSGATHFLFLGQVQLEPGSTATDFEYRQPTAELNLCQRYYHKSYGTPDAPATITNNGMVAYFAGGTAGEWAPYVLYPAEMRSIPFGSNFVFYSPNSGSTNAIYNASDNVNEAATGPNGQGLQSHTGKGGSHTANKVYRYHFVVNAEL